MLTGILPVEFMWVMMALGAILIILFIYLILEDEIKKRRPHNRAVDIFTSISSMEISRKENNEVDKEVYKRIEKAKDTVKREKNTPIIKYLLEEYEPTLVKIKAILGETEKMKTIEKKVVHNEVANLVKKFIEEIEEYEKTENELREKMEKTRIKELLKITREEDKNVKAGKLKDLKQKAYGIVSK